MKTSHTDPEKQTREWMKASGKEKPSEGFTRLVMEKVETKKRLYPYKKDNNVWHYILAVGLPLITWFTVILAGRAHCLRRLTFNRKYNPTFISSSSCSRR